MKSVAIIPARGGSKRIPKKNIKPFLGKPIIAYSIQAAINSGCFDEVMVSTDDDEIKKIALEAGAKVPFTRSQENANDFAHVGDVIIEVIEAYKKENIEFETLCCILPTAPFITPQMITEAYNQFSELQVEAIMPVVKFSYPIQRALKRNEKGIIRLFQPEHLLSRSQDLEPAYHDAGMFYWAKTTEFLKTKNFMMLNCGTIIIEEDKAQDIDTEEDWRIAEQKFKLIYS